LCVNYKIHLKVSLNFKVSDDLLENCHLIDIVDSSRTKKYGGFGLEHYVAVEPLC